MGNLARWRSGERVAVRGERWKVVDETPFADCAALRLSGIGALNTGRARTLLTPFDRLRPLSRRSSWRVVRPRRWLHALRRAALDVHPYGGLRAAAETRVDLLPYQIEPALAMWRHAAPRVLIADDVGLGKTIEAGLILRECAARVEGARALVLTPAGLRDQWAQELRALFDLTSVRADSAWLRNAARRLPPDVNPWALPGIFISSYDFVKRPEVLRALEDATWDLVVADEVHGAGIGTDRQAAVHAAALRARRVVLLTATPHAGDPAQFESICRIGTRDARDRIVMFRRSRRGVGGGARRRTAVLPVRPSDAERRMHRLLEGYTAAVCREADARGDPRARLAAIVLRKRALSSAASLAASTRRRLDLLTDAAGAQQMILPMFDEDPLPDAAPDSMLAAPGLADGTRERRWLSAIAQAAQTAAGGETKIAFLRRLLARIREPAIVFTEYRDTLARLQAALARSGRAVLVLHGGMTPPERAVVQRQFNDASGLLLATDAASEGLNLHTRCRVVVHYELPWSPARLQQRTGRVDRIGQRRTVHEIVLVADDTAERLVLAPLLRRAARACAEDGDADPDARRGLFEQLTESRVAAAVMADDRVEPPVDSAALRPACVVRADLTAEAEAETTRLRLRRQWSSRSLCSARQGPEDAGLLVSVLRNPRWAIAGTLVYRLSVVADDSSIVHTELVPIEFDVAPGTLVAGAASAVRNAAAAIVDRYDPIARRLLKARFDSRIAHTIDDHAEAIAVRQRRERTIAESFPAAAQQLVQPGLFDGRALRQAASRRQLAAALHESVNDRLAVLCANEHVAVSLEIVALLLTAPRRAGA